MSYGEDITCRHETVTPDVLKLICKLLESQEIHELGHKTNLHLISRYKINENWVCGYFMRFPSLLIGLIDWPLQFRSIKHSQVVLLGYSCSFPNPSNVTRYSNRCTKIKSIFNKMELFSIYLLKDLIKEISPDAYSNAFRDGLLHKMLPYVG